MQGVPRAPGWLPLLGHLMYFTGSGGSYFESIRAIGSIVEDSTFSIHLPGTPTMVFTRDAGLTKRVFRSQGKQPIRIPMWPMDRWFARNQIPDSTLTGTGERWMAQRQAFNTTLMQGAFADSHRTSITRTANDLAEAMSVQREPAAATIPSLRTLLAYYGLQAISPLVHGFAPLLLGAGVQSERVDFVGSDGPTAAFALERQTLDALVRGSSAVFESEMECETSLAARYTNHSAAWTRFDADMRQLYDASFAVLDRVAAARGNADSSSLLATLSEVNSPNATAPSCTLLDRAAGIDFLRDEVELRQVLTDALTGAIETTTQSMEWALLHLAMNQDAQERARVEAFADDGHAGSPWIRACVKESLRLTPPFYLHFRQLVKPVRHTEAPWSETAPLTLPEGTVVVMDIFTMGRDPAYVSGPTAPNRFDPRRFLRDSGSQCPFRTNPHAAALPFGHGPRKCAGSGFAQLSMVEAIAAVLRRFRLTVSAPPGFDGDLERAFEPQWRLTLQPATSPSAHLHFEPVLAP